MKKYNICRILNHFCHVSLFIAFEVGLLSYRISLDPHSVSNEPEQIRTRCSICFTHWGEQRFGDLIVIADHFWSDHDHTWRSWLNCHYDHDARRGSRKMWSNNSLHSGATSTSPAMRSRGYSLCIHWHLLIGDILEATNGLRAMWFGDTDGDSFNISD